MKFFVEDLDFFLNCLNLERKNEHKGGASLISSELLSFAQLFGKSFLFLLFRGAVVRFLFFKC